MIAPHAENWWQPVFHPQVSAGHLNSGTDFEFGAEAGTIAERQLSRLLAGDDSNLGDAKDWSIAFRLHPNGNAIRGIVAPNLRVPLERQQPAVPFGHRGKVAHNVVVGDGVAAVFALDDSDGPRSMRVRDPD